MTSAELNLTFTWVKIDDPNPTSKRVRLDSGDEARIFCVMPEGDWFAVVNERCKSGLESEADAIRHAEGELARQIACKIEDARKVLETYAPIMMPNSTPEMEAA